MARVANILCPIDFSEFSRCALDRAVRLARLHHAVITAIHVVEPNGQAGEEDRVVAREVRQVHAVRGHQHHEERAREDARAQLQRGEDEAFADEGTKRHAPGRTRRPGRLFRGAHG